MSESSVTFLLPVHNESKNPFLKKTLESIFSQQIDNSELVIVDDGSSDDTITKVLEMSNELGCPMEIKIIRNENNLGIAESLNKGITNSRGVFVSRIDAGDYMEEKRTIKQLNYLESKKDVYILGTLCKKISERGEFAVYTKENTPFTHEELKKKCLYHNYLMHSSWMIRKELFDKIGYYKPEFRCEDYELYLRAMVKGYKVEIIPEFLTKIWDNPKGISISYLKEIQRDRLKIRLRYFRYFPYFWNAIGILKSIIGVTLPRQVLGKLQSKGY